MSYTPRPGDYGVVKTQGTFGKLIRVGTMSRWNHAFICIDEHLIVEANPTGVEISPITKYPLIAWNQHEELTQEQRQNIVDAAVNLVGRPYGFFDIFVLALRILGLKMLSNTKFMEYAAMRYGVICSELVAISYDKAGISLVSKPDNLVTPGDLAERLIYQ
jgi:uncharacterized protein YycO